MLADLFSIAGIVASAVVSGRLIVLAASTNIRWWVILGVVGLELQIVGLLIRMLV